MMTGDGAYIKKINRSYILGQIVEHGMISRAELSKITGLNKATISVQVSDLLDEELIYETRQEHNTVGRRPIMLSLNNQAGYVLGIDLEYKHITYNVSDLLGNSLTHDIVELNTSDYDQIIQILVDHIGDYINTYSDSGYGIVNVVVSVHGTVNKDEQVFFIPRHQWHNKNLKEDLENQLDTTIHIENNANLCALAEKVYQYHHTDNLLCINMYTGIGLGIIMDGELIKGYHGYAGEMGHMVLFPEGKPCRCGNKGCWELYASESSLFSLLAEQMNNQQVSYDLLKKWLKEQNADVCEQMEQFLKYISIGLNNIINLYNPETIVLNSEVLHLYPNAIDKIKEHLTSSVSQYRDIVISDLGKRASVMGACAFGIKNFLKIPELSLDISETV
ncbi:ROK family transcriptional regulator [Aquibacillus sediminis]|uniref:ROK family transcriptional regulator n=1 Tax=Aquibacillus sediminis TaxID=2574734 RepID=UPI001108D908|nr:ROK family transcriptional regulator [Aquibacillus sediminis]